MAKRKSMTSDKIEELVNLSDCELSDLSSINSEVDCSEISSASTSESESDISDNQDCSAHSWTDVSSFDPGPSSTIPIYNIQQGPILPSHFDQIIPNFDQILMLLSYADITYHNT
jgi:uncharacterized Zn-finger protein